MKAWWSSLTSSNRHADSKRSPYNPSFTSIRTGLTSDSVLSLNKHTGYSSYAISPASSQLNLSSNPYSPQIPGLSRRDTGNTTSGLLMQDFHNGVALPPPVADSWKRIDHWTEENYPELYDQLSYGATEADVDELEHALELSLPGDVRESFFIHDGQERGGRPTGLFFGIALLDCEELVDEYDLWKKVAASLPRHNEYPQYLTSNNRQGSSNRARSPPRRPRQTTSRQASKPEGTIQAVYAHPGWIPLAKDYMGNNIAIDMSPGPKGRVGQVILFGRECDVKYVIAPSWASFLASYVSDLESDNVVVDEDVGVGGDMGQLRYLIDPEHPDQQQSYLETLKARVRRRDRAVRGSQSEAGSSLPGHMNNTTRKNGKARAPSPLKHENIPRPVLLEPLESSSHMTPKSPALHGGVVIDRKEKSIDDSLTASIPQGTIVASKSTDITAEPESMPHEAQHGNVSLENVQLNSDTTPGKSNVPEHSSSNKASSILNES